MAVDKYKASAKAFVFSWTIDNFSFCLEEPNKFLNSPFFTVNDLEETQWYLQYFPNGHLQLQKNGTFVKTSSAFRLCRAKQDSGPQSISVSFDCEFSTKGSSFKFLRNFNVDFDPNHVSEYVYMEKSQLPSFELSDSLVLKCRMWRDREKIPFETTAFSAFTRIDVNKYSFIWILEHAKEKWSLKQSECRKKTKTTGPNLLASLVESGDSNQTHLKFEFVPLNDYRFGLSRCKINLVDMKGFSYLLDTYEITREEYEKQNEWHFSLELNWNNLVCQKQIHLPKNVLTFRVELLTTCGLISTHTIDKISSQLTKNSTPEFPKDQLPDNTILTSLFQLWTENILTDVKLKTATSEFSAHRVVLSSSSEVFKSMFTTDMSEKNSEFVDVSDLLDDVVSCLLFYSYTGKVKDLDWNLAVDKYQMQGLQDQCFDFFMQNLTPTNVVEAFFVADMQQNDNLKVFVENYIIKHFSNVLNSENWKAFELEKPNIALEMHRNISLKMK